MSHSMRRGKNQLYVEKTITSFAKMMLQSINRHHVHDTRTKFLFKRVTRGADARMKKEMLLHYFY